MRTYFGSKLIKATPMTRAAYNEYRDWELPEDENGADTGYLVEHIGGGEANHPAHAGYISWSPTVVFEGAYLDLGELEDTADHVVRMVAEQAQLAERLEKLLDFLKTPGFLDLDLKAKALLRAQAGAMARYADILGKRLAS